MSFILEKANSLGPDEALNVSKLTPEGKGSFKIKLVPKERRLRIVTLPEPYQKIAFDFGKGQEGAKNFLRLLDLNEIGIKFLIEDSNIGENSFYITNGYFKSQVYGINGSISKLFPKTDKRWDCLVHKTRFDDLERIKESGYLKLSEDAEPGVYMSYNFSDVTKELRSSWSWTLFPNFPGITLYFSSKVLQDYPFRVCPDIDYGCQEDKSIESGKGKLKHRPEMTKTKEYINQTQSYLSLELMILNEVSLKYLICIICYNITKQQYEEVQNLFVDTPVIPLKFFDKDYNMKFYFNKIVPILSHFSN